MNIDDLICVGATDNILVSSTIGRNKNLIPGDVRPTTQLSHIQQSESRQAEWMLRPAASASTGASVAGYNAYRLVGVCTVEDSSA